MRQPFTVVLWAFLTVLMMTINGSDQITLTTAGLTKGFKLAEAVDDSDPVPLSEYKQLEARFESLNATLTAKIDELTPKEESCWAVRDQPSGWFVLKGFSHEVYCNNDIDGGGWMRFYTTGSTYATAERIYFASTDVATAKADGAYYVGNESANVMAYLSRKGTRETLIYKHIGEGIIADGTILPVDSTVTFRYEQGPLTIRALNTHVAKTVRMGLTNDASVTLRGGEIGIVDVSTPFDYLSPNYYYDQSSCSIAYYECYTGSSTADKLRAGYISSYGFAGWTAEGCVIHAGVSADFYVR